MYVLHINSDYRIWVEWISVGKKKVLKNIAYKQTKSNPKWSETQRISTIWTRVTIFHGDNRYTYHNVCKVRENKNLNSLLNLSDVRL